MTDTILVLNAGSSSIKFALYSLDDQNIPPLMVGKITGIGRAPEFSVKNDQGVSLDANDFAGLHITATHEDLIGSLLEWVNNHNVGMDIVAVGHRVVHGGRVFTQPVVVDRDTLSSLEDLIPLAPLHQPHNLSAIEAIIERAPELPQVACFDTSFHHTQNALAQLFPIPRELSDAGIIRYGFHGLSYEYIASVLPNYIGDKADGRVVIAHLGNGASLCAMNDGRSVATSMGFTALHGLMMGSRSGTLDVGIVLHLLQTGEMDLQEVEDMLYRKSGLLGVSGVSNNMQVLEESTDAHAKEAIDLFCYRAASEISSLLVASNGLDVLVFTAGIGENSANTRQLICDHLGWLGIELDNQLNITNEGIISSENSKIDVLVIPTNEEVVIANATRKLLQAKHPTGENNH